ncbi:MAG: tetratricopeptide repeat protein [Nitrospirae bacterium]|nr:tetratricopeptide repeat protein [Nitrospirota bacterium]
MAITGAFVFAETPSILSAEKVAEQAKALWESGAMPAALEILEQGIHDYPQTLTLQKLRGDILAASRGPQEAVQAYETALAGMPAALDVRWAKWSVLVRWGQAEEAISELRRMALLDGRNPLIQLRLAQELRKLDRLEESLESYKKAVELAPDLLGWRLALARARFDVLDYPGAEADLNYVLQKATPGSPLELPAKNQLAQLYESMERGRRFTPVITPGSTPSQLKEWAAIRADAWKLFEAGRYQEAEPVYRRLLALNPRDPVATHQLGLTLMQLGRCEDALRVFGNMSNLNPNEEDYADTVFRMGQCLVELERWEDAFVHFQLLYDTAVEFEESNKHVALPAGTRVLSKEKIGRWLEKVRPHVPELAKLKDEEAKAGSPPGEVAPASVPTEEELYMKAIERIKPQKALDTGAALIGRDADFSWFRFVIPAGKVVRDDFPTGAHEFIPLNPGDTFPTTQPEIYLVFGLVSDSFDAVPLTARCVVETSEMTEESRAAAQDRVMTSMNDRSGYFLLIPPKTGWSPGLYRCGLFAGERTTAYTYVDEVRFRIIDPARRS